VVAKVKLSVGFNELGFYIPVIVNVIYAPVDKPDGKQLLSVTYGESMLIIPTYADPVDTDIVTLDVGIDDGIEIYEVGNVIMIPPPEEIVF
jgi:hypothetical protein